MGLEDRACGKRWPCFVHSNHVRGCETNSDKILYIYIKKKHPRNIFIHCPPPPPKDLFLVFIYTEFIKERDMKYLGGSYVEEDGLSQGEEMPQLAKCSSLRIRARGPSIQVKSWCVACSCVPSVAGRDRRISGASGQIC